MRPIQLAFLFFYCMHDVPSPFDSTQDFIFHTIGPTDRVKVPEANRKSNKISKLKGAACERA
jgi:hypothetical protein